MNPNLPNLACQIDASPHKLQEIDNQVERELQIAGICTYHLPRNNKAEVPTGWTGDHRKWVFNRAWRYWIAKGPGIPPDKAEKFHKEWGKEVRVEGHCGCPSPLEYNCGFAVGLYHIDTQEGLNAFAKLLEEIHDPQEKKNKEKEEWDKRKKEIMDMVKPEHQEEFLKFARTGECTPEFLKLIETDYDEASGKMLDMQMEVICDMMKIIREDDNKKDVITISQWWVTIPGLIFLGLAIVGLIKEWF